VQIINGLAISPKLRGIGGSQKRSRVEDYLTIGIGHIGLTHPLLGFGGVGKMRTMASLFHLVD
jgi:hypothetical protein